MVSVLIAKTKMRIRFGMLFRINCAIDACFDIILSAGLQPAHTPSRDLYLLQLSFIGKAVEHWLADAERFTSIFVE